MNDIGQILSTLNPKQREAVMYNGGPCLIIAGAGTGKTKTLTCKIAKLIADGVNPSRILAVTFTNKAAKEMRARIETMVPGAASRVWMHTFHGFAVRVLRANFEAAGLSRDFVIYDEDDQKKIINLVLEEMGFADAGKETKYFVNEISRAKDSMLYPQYIDLQRETGNDDRKKLMAVVYKKYQQKLATAGALDFGDLLMRVVELFKNNESVRDFYQNYFQYALVDEYQDTNRTQYMLIKILAEKHRNLCVVGDPDQSIYSWRGADIHNILDFAQDFKDAKVITLEQNYRSTQVILDASNKLISKNEKRYKKNLFTEIKSGEPICVRRLFDEGEEARWVANKITALVDEDGISLDDVVIFYRKNVQSRNFEATFRQYKIPYRLVGDLRFYERKEIKDILSYSKLLVNPNDTVSLLRVINTPRRGIGDSAQEALVNHANENNISLYKALRENDFVDGLKPTARRGVKEFVNLIEGLALDMQTYPPSTVLRQLLEASGYLKFIEKEREKDPDAASREENLKEFIKDTEEYEGRCIKEDIEPTLSGYLQEVALISGEDETAGAQNGAVTLMTVHLAKGLEFPVVFVTGLEDGLFPLIRKSGDNNLEEERRLCYVAMTRAKKYLHMCYCAKRYISGMIYPNNLASTFLTESGLMDEDTRQREHMERKMEQKEVRPRHRFWNNGDRWTAKNSVSYDNSKNYQDNDYSAPNKPAIVQESDSAPSPTGDGVKVGSRVKHGVFGAGRVSVISGAGDSAKITVIFDNSVKRVFMLKYAPLEIL